MEDPTPGPDAPGPTAEQVRAGDDAPDLEGRRVLVTGGAGFVGSHLVAALAPENDVRVLDDLSAGTRANVHPAATLVQGDVRDPDAVTKAMDGVEIVFHEAAMVSVPRSVEEPLACHERNATGTLTVLERARAEDARVVLASTTAVYGEPATLPVPETAATAPRSPYAVSKLAAEEYAATYTERYGLPTVALRYFNVYGPGQPPGPYSGVITAFLDALHTGAPLRVHGDGSQTRDFVHVSDVVRANLAAATTDGVGTAYNVGTGQETSIRELAELLATVSERDIEIVHTEGRDEDVQRSCADISRSRATLGFEPRVSLEDGLAALVE
jgi:UDP-glucose 4-epimerase